VRNGRRITQTSPSHSEPVMSVEGSCWPKRVLVFPGGTEIGLEVNRSLGYCKEIELHSAGTDVSNHAPFVFRNHDVVPDINDPTWVGRLNAVIDRHAIDYVIPAHDDVVLALARHVDDLRAKVITSPLATCEIARSKTKTYRWLAGVVPAPALLDPSCDVEFPVFVKPDVGQGSQGAALVLDREQLSARLQERPDLLVMEYLPGEEFTVDCFSDRERGVLFCAGRRRVRMRNGISMDSYGVESPEFLAIASAISTQLEFHGAWFFQVRRDSQGELKLLEVAPRLAGTMALHRVQGINFPLLSIFEQERMPIRILRNSANVRIDRALANRYRHDLSYQTVYVDLDDTLLVRNLVNTELVRFLYQCVGRGIRIVVLTRHAEDPNETLARFRLTGLPDEVVHLRCGESKAEFVTRHPAIFIDDSFSERLSVFEATGTPTFDCSMIEMLLDDRV